MLTIYVIIMNVLLERCVFDIKHKTLPNNTRQEPLPLGVWEGMPFVVVALPGLFSPFFFHLIYPHKRIAVTNVALLCDNP